MITIENNQYNKAGHEPKVGDVYGRIEEPNVLYLVTKHHSYVGNGHPFYGLINISTGNMYSNAKSDINDIFSDYSDKFYLITKDIKITID